MDPSSHRRIDSPRVLRQAQVGVVPEWFIQTQLGEFVITDFFVFGQAQLVRRMISEVICPAITEGLENLCNRRSTASESFEYLFFQNGAKSFPARLCIT
jgi:hypothetical protein